MRPLSTALLCLLVCFMVGCSDTPASTTTVNLGRVTLAEFRSNTVYNAWYTTGYDGYPDAAAQPAFDANVAKIRSVLDSSQHKVVMAIKPSCGCQDTQREMPRVMKTLDAAGFPQSNVEIYVTDARLAGIDDAKATYGINDAPTFIVLKNGKELGRIVEAPALGKTIDQELADLFMKP
jgi:hypothetical protein